SLARRFIRTTDPADTPGRVGTFGTSVRPRLIAPNGPSQGIARMHPPLAKVACLLAIASALMGCKNPVQERTSGRIVAEMPPQNNVSPVVPGRVLNTGTESGQRVAIIDVDGLLLNMDMVGPSSHGENPVSLFREKLDAAACDPCVRAVV